MVNDECKSRMVNGEWCTAREYQDAKIFGGPYLPIDHSPV